MVDSPCEDTYDSCNLNDNDRCTTCKRTIDDIINWSQMDDEEQRERIIELEKKFNTKNV
jgi:predicted Fe-S protein YdhL (DUF1289 family)